MARNKKLILLALVILTIWVFSNYRPNLYLFAITTLPGFPISLIASCGNECPAPYRDFVPNIPSLYGDYIITTEASFYAKGDAGRSCGNRADANSYVMIGACGDGVGVSACQCGPSYPTCGGNTPSMSASKSSKIRVVTSTADNTQQCYINDVLVDTKPLLTSGIGIKYAAQAVDGNYGGATATTTSSFLTIEDTSSKRFIEYNIYDTFDTPTLDLTRWTSSGTIDARFGKIYLTGTLNMLENMKGRIVYLEYETTGTGSVSLTDSIGNSYTLNLGGQESGVIKLESSPLYPDKMYWFFRGKQVKEIDYSAVDKVTFTISGTNVFIDNVGFRVLFQTCSLGKNQFLAYETFTGPRTISHYSARKMIQQYCINLPPALKKGTGFEEVPELIGILANGKTYNVVSGDTVILPYIYTKTDTETLPCIPGSGQIFDVETNTCKDIRGITFFCSEGQWNVNTHSCEVYPEIRYICDGVLDTTDPENPLCIWHPPSQAICP